MIGLTLPFLTKPKELAGKHVVLGVDNIAVWHGWNARGIPNDIAASIWIRALFLIGYFLGCTIHVRHIPRKSTVDSYLADAVSRAFTTTAKEQAEPPRILLDWLNQPREDWNFALDLLDFVSVLCEFE